MSTNSNWRRQWHSTPVLLPGKSRGRRSRAGCSPRGWWESDMTEWLHFHFSLSCLGEGNGNPLHYSCLENLRDGGAWWAAIYGVTELDTTEATWQQQQQSANDPNVHERISKRWHIHMMKYWWLKVMTYWYLLQNGCAFNIVQVKEVSHKKTHIEWFQYMKFPE